MVTAIFHTRVQPTVDDPWGMSQQGEFDSYKIEVRVVRSNPDGTFNIRMRDGTGRQNVPSGRSPGEVSAKCGLPLVVAQQLTSDIDDLCNDDNVNVAVVARVARAAINGDGTLQIIRTLRDVAIKQEESTEIRVDAIMALAIILLSAGA